MQPEASILTCLEPCALARGEGQMGHWDRQMECHGTLSGGEDACQDDALGKPVRYGEEYITLDHGSRVLRQSHARSTECSERVSGGITSVHDALVLGLSSPRAVLCVLIDDHQGPGLVLSVSM